MNTLSGVNHGSPWAFPAIPRWVMFILWLQGPSGASQRQTATDDDDWDAPDPEAFPAPLMQQLISPFQMVPQNKKR